MSGTGQEVATVLEDVAGQTGPALAEDFAGAYKGVLHETAEGLEQNATRVAENEANITGQLTSISESGGQEALSSAEQEAGSLGSSAATSEEGSLGNAEGGGGQASEGNGGTENGDTDPVDVVSGQMLADETDLSLAGRLPLVLRRAYASGYRGGRLFGPGWSSTLDQRVEIDEDGVHFAGDDAQILHYPVPSQPGLAVLPADGARWPLVWDRAGDVIRIEDPERGLSYEFSAGASLSGWGGEIRPLTRIVDRNGNSVTFLRDGDGLPVEVRHSGGYRVMVDTVSVTGGFRIEGLRLLDGAGGGQGVQIVEYRYDPRGRLAEVVDSSGVPFVYEFDSADRINAWIDRNGFEYRYEYDERGRVARGLGPDGHLSVSLRYDDEHRVTTVTNALGAPTEYHYDEYRHLTRVVDPLGNETLTRYDRYGRLLLRTDPLGNSTRRDLSDAGDPIAIHHADGGVTTVTYNTLRLPTEVLWPDGARWQYAYDERGNLSSAVAPDGGVTRYGYDERGALVQVTDALGATSRLEVNAAGLPVAQTDALGATLRIERDAFGRVVAVTDPFGGVTRAGWSVEGRVLWQERADGARERWAYDPGGNLVEYRNPADAVTAFEYGAFSLPAARIEPTGARYRFAYDAMLRLTAVTGPSGLSWRYEYDAAGNLVGESDFDGRRLGYAFDAAGRLVESRVGELSATRYERDALGRLVTRRVGERVTEYGYDPCGRLIRAAGPEGVVEIARDSLGRIVAESFDGRTHSSEYDLLGRRVRRTTPGGQVSQWRYGPTGLPLGLSTDAGGLTFEYDAGGRETSRFLGAGAALTQTYDANHRLSSQAIWAYDRPNTGGDAAGGYRNVQERSFNYRPDGNPLEITDELRGARTFETDPSGRVTAVTAATWRETYAYDALGNLAHASYPTGGGADEAQGEREYDGVRLRRAGRVSYEHDGQGRVVKVIRRTLSGQSRVWTYTWDDENRLAQATAPDGARWRYLHDPLGRRVAKQCLGQDGAVEHEVWFVWDQTRLAEQHTMNGDGRAQATTWDWEPSTYRAAAQTVRSWAADAPRDQIDATFYAIVTDLVGTPSELVTADGRIAWYQTRSLWGETIAAPEAQVDCPLRFPGQYRDEESGLDYNFFRHYAPETGRYLSPDPLGLAPAPNPYSYAHNPLTWFDPLGLACLKGNQTYLYRAVQEKELAQILETRTFTNPQGIETKYFSLTEEGANAYARGAYQQWPSEGPYTIVRTTIDKDLIPADSAIPHLADRGVGDAVALPTDVLPSLGRPRILPYGLTGS